MTDSMNAQTNFAAKVRAAECAHKSLLCVGLDPIVDRLPASCGSGETQVFEFCRQIVDACSDLVLAFKPQIAHFAAARALGALQDVIAYIHANTRVPVILDAKRGDIGSTAEMYAREVFEVYGADAATVNPYLGQDSFEPFTAYADKGVICCAAPVTQAARNYKT